MRFAPYTCRDAWRHQQGSSPYLPVQDHPFRLTEAGSAKPARANAYREARGIPDDPEPAGGKVAPCQNGDFAPGQVVHRYRSILNAQSPPTDDNSRPPSTKSTHRRPRCNSIVPASNQRAATCDARRFPGSPQAVRKALAGNAEPAPARTKVWRKSFRPASSN